MRTAIVITILTGLVGGATLSTSCREHTTSDEVCYPADPWVDWQGDPRERGFCDYESRPLFEDLPEGINSEVFSHCFDLEPGGACDGCPADETEQLLIDAYIEERECKEPPTDNIGGCSHKTHEDEGTINHDCCTRATCDHVVVDFIRGCHSVSADGKQCCYSAVIASPCAGGTIY